MISSPADVARRLREIIRSGVFVHKTDPAILTEAAALLDRQAAPVDGLETTAEDIAILQRVAEVGILGTDPDRVGRIVRDHDRLTATFAARDAKIAHERKAFANKSEQYVAERQRAGRLAEALKRIANPSTIAGKHQQDQGPYLQGIARAALKGEPT